MIVAGEREFSTSQTHPSHDNHHKLTMDEDKLGVCKVCSKIEEKKKVTEA